VSGNALDRCVIGNRLGLLEGAQDELRDQAHRPDSWRRTTGHCYAAASSSPSDPHCDASTRSAFIPHARRRGLGGTSAAPARHLLRGVKPGSRQAEDESLLFCHWITSKFPNGLGLEPAELLKILELRHRFEKPPAPVKDKVAALNDLLRKVRSLLQPALGGHGGEHNSGGRNQHTKAEVGQGDIITLTSPEEPEKDALDFAWAAGPAEQDVAAEQQPVELPGADRGTSKAYLTRRLKRDHPELAAKVEAGELTAHAAAIQAGIKVPVIQIPKDPERAAGALVKHFKVEQVREICRMAMEAAGDNAYRPGDRWDGLPRDSDTPERPVDHSHQGRSGGSWKPSVARD
jgi:hypothetical protein